DGLPEPLCAIYEPAILTAVDDAIAGQKFCPRKVLLNSNIHGVDQQTHQWTFNANTPQEAETLKGLLAT
ncbi:MAG: molybdenum cofactor biosynthesis protein MoaAD, partial [Acidobacteria bacterium]|nr:molybdenum cofactor biosynthesis protein MoaAD [Acidobacteriota bacterium]